ncbi:MAG: hypothetical protein CM15mP44_9400 [Candidatus Neomarinimicrobiota bacterium]|nr:MAG: hypothetical protein CM15mP44_9400 [Candidatus Neomarinimicrobiota bacterium]
MLKTLGLFFPHPGNSFPGSFYGLQMGSFLKGYFIFYANQWTLMIQDSGQCQGNLIN